MAMNSVSVALAGSGGAGVMTAGQMLLDAAARAGYLGLMTRSTGPQIRGGEAAAFVRLGTSSVNCPDDNVTLLLAFDWGNIDRFAAELALTDKSIIVSDPSQGEVPAVLAESGAKIVELPMKDMVAEIAGGRVNMVGLGAVCKLIGLDLEVMADTVAAALKKKGAEAIAISRTCIDKGSDAAGSLGVDLTLEKPGQSSGENRWNISGNEAAGLGALRGGVRFCAAYPITPSTEILEWLAPKLPLVGGSLVQAEDELASINMIIGGSFSGVPSLTATSGPGLSLMIEALGLAVASETPIVVVDVMRGGPSTGIPTKSEQSDLNIALYGLHGDAPHLVTAPLTIGDCLFTTQWSVYLAEALQTACIVLSDQSLGQSRAVVEKPADIAFLAKRKTPTDMADYKRYAVTADGISPMSVPGMPGGEYVADGLEHAENANPSSNWQDHEKQMNKRQRKLDMFDFGDHWAEIANAGEGDVAIVTFGSIYGAVNEAVERLKADGKTVRMVAMRLLSPVQQEKLAAALEGVSKVLVVEQTHSGQFYRYLRAHYDLPGEVRSFARPGPLPVRPQEIVRQITDWS